MRALADLRVLVERVFTLASRNNRIATTEIFEELLAVYADGEALETWTISGTTGTTRPLIHSIFERAGPPTRSSRDQCINQLSRRPHHDLYAIDALDGLICAQV